MGPLLTVTLTVLRRPLVRVADSSSIPYGRTVPVAVLGRLERRVVDDGPIRAVSVESSRWSRGDAVDAVGHIEKKRQVVLAGLCAERIAGPRPIKYFGPNERPNLVIQVRPV